MPRYEHKCIKDHCEFLFEVTYGIKEEPKVTEDMELVPISTYNKTKIGGGA